MSEWITWSPCSMSCGPGVRSRERYVKQFPDDGFPCTHPTEEIEPCTVNEDCCEYYSPGLITSQINLNISDVYSRNFIDSSQFLPIANCAGRKC